MKKKEKSELTTEGTISYSYQSGSIPLVGWHNPWAECKSRGLDFSVSIAGGCQAITVRLKGKSTYLEIPINALLGANFELIEALKDMD